MKRPPRLSSGLVEALESPIAHLNQAARDAIMRACYQAESWDHVAARLYISRRTLDRLRAAYPEIFE